MLLASKISCTTNETIPSANDMGTRCANPRERVCNGGCGQIPKWLVVYALALRTGWEAFMLVMTRVKERALKAAGLGL